jgi:hypothetical protein
MKIARGHARWVECRRLVVGRRDGKVPCTIDELRSRFVVGQEGLEPSRLLTLGF